MKCIKFISSIELTVNIFQTSLERDFINTIERERKKGVSNFLSQGSHLMRPANVGKHFTFFNRKLKVYFFLLVQLFWQVNAEIFFWQRGQH